MLNKKLNSFEFKKVLAYVKFDLREVLWNTTLTWVRE